MLLGRMRFRRRGDDERADAAARFQNAGAFELRIDTRHGVRVDAQFDRELTDGRQLVAGDEAAGGDRGAQCPIELRVDRRPVPRIDGDDSHEFIVLVD